MISKPLIFNKWIPFSCIDFALGQWFHKIKHVVFSSNFQSFPRSLIRLRTQNQFAQMHWYCVAYITVNSVPNICARTKRKNRKTGSAHPVFLRVALEYITPLLLESIIAYAFPDCKVHFTLTFHITSNCRERQHLPRIDQIGIPTDHAFICIIDCCIFSHMITDLHLSDNSSNGNLFMSWIFGHQINQFNCPSFFIQ